MAYVRCQNLHVAFGGKPLLNAADLVIGRNERIGLVGRNGEGKSTLLKVVAGLLEPDEGTVQLGTGVHCGLLEQQAPEGLKASVGVVVREGVPPDVDGDHSVQRLCSLLKLDPEAPFEAMSGGQKRRALLGRALAAEPDVLLLDEPTNHLDIESIQWLERFLQRYEGSLLFVTHDRAFLQAVATRIIELDRGQLRSWDCSYAKYLERKEALLQAEEKQWAQFDKKLAQEEAWIRQGIKARRTRNEGRVKALERMRDERVARRERSGKARLEVQDTPRSGHKVIEVENVSYTWVDDGETMPILRDFSATIMRGDKIGIIGPNGCGKTTLLNLLLGRLKPEAGTIEHGTSLEIAYFDQHRHELDGRKSVFENVADGKDEIILNGGRRHVMGYLQDFLFSPERARQPVGSLSGGERNRLLLARMLAEPSNVMVLDEPTNDLDLETLELLESMLVDTDSTVLLVSHDRDFLDHICTSCLVFEEEGGLNEYVGGYSDWQRCVQARGKEAASSASAKSAKASQQPARQKKLSNKERERHQKLPGLIEKMEEDLEGLHQQMNDPQFYRGDEAAIRELTDKAKTLPEDIEKAYEEWEELELRA